MTSRAPNWLTVPPDWRGLHVTLMGLGSFGGGEGAVRFLAERGALVTVTDLKPAAALGTSVERVSALAGVTLHLGRHDPADFREIDLLVVNPAVQRDNPFLRLAIAAGVPLTSEMNLFWLLNRSRIIGVTGSNGKSTTTTLIHAMLQAAGFPVRIGGNIGRSLLPEVENLATTDWTVLELSSFQLADLDPLQRSPEITVVTNFAPNHQDRHASIDEYRNAKQTILRWQHTDDIAILNADDADVASWPVTGRRFTFGNSHTTDAQLTGDSIVVHSGKPVFELSLAASRSLPGRHNAANVAAAALAALAAGANVSSIRTGICKFQSLPHRLEFLGEHHGRRFYNDSKSTTPEAAIAALEAVASLGNIILLAGGADKHVDLTRFATAIREHVKAVALLGETAAILESLFRQPHPVFSGEPQATTPPAFYHAASFTDAFEWALRQSAAGDVILLSPGCASLDWFANYEDRGRQFAQLVQEYRLTSDR
jgi:UDP-N-acetylmuramoylalanine--D-glutamate ligase